METRSQLAAQLRDAERAEAAPWIDYPDSPPWLMPAFGVFAATLTLSMSLLDGLPRALAMLAHVALTGAYVGWERRRRGSLPNPWLGAPREFRRAMVTYFVAIVAVIGVVFAATSLANAWVGAAIALLGAAATIWWYERAYAAAAQATRKRLA